MASRPRGRRELEERVLEALDAGVRPKATSLRYRLALTLTCLIVVVLPLLYVALVAAVGWGVVWYGRHGPALVEDVEGARLLVLLEYGPLVVGVVLFSFLLKPLLARPSRREVRTSLRPEDEPFLFEFLARLARRLDAPPPRRVEVDLAVHVSMGPARGPWSLVSGELALTIGLPLAASMSVRELTGVLAHEFGHFAQGAGLRSYTTASAVHRWLARVVYERDAWDERLDRWSRGRFWLATLVLSPAQRCVWLSRRLLLLLMKAGAAVSAPFSREMELDADRNAVRLVGTGAFADAMRLLHRLEVASQWAGEVNDQARAEGHLVDDYPGLVAAGLHEIDPELLGRIVAGSLEGTVGMYATHPSTGQRIARAEELDDDGAFDVEAPASVLFHDLRGLCREQTEEAYRATQGDGLEEHVLSPVSSLCGGDRKRGELAAQVVEYFRRVVPGPRQLAAAPLVVPRESSAAEAFAALQDARRQVRAREASARLALRDHGAADMTLQTARASARLWGLGLTPLPPCSAFSKRTAPLAVRAQEELVEETEAELALMTALQQERIGLTLALLADPRVRERCPDAGELVRRIQGSHRALVALGPAAEALRALREASRRFEAIWPTLAAGEDPAKGERLLATLLTDLHERLAATAEAAGERPYPFEHARGPLSLAEALVTLPESRDGPSVLVAACRSTVVAWDALLLRHLGELAAAALRAEEALGLASLGVPESAPPPA